MDNKTSKHNGSIYTPTHIVDNMLDLVGYQFDIIQKHVIDNSCGEGAFLIQIVKRYCEQYFLNSGNCIELKMHLEKYIHGIDNDSIAVEKCKANLTLVAESFNVNDVNWDIKVADTLDVDMFNGKMDYVVGNPPYIRVHNLKNSYNKVKKYDFASNGMTDLYIVFFEISFRMLSPNGKMCFITPSSFLRSKAGIELRKYIHKRRTLTKIVDLGHYQPFSATTYTIITVFENDQKNNNSVEYFTYDELESKPEKIEDLEYEKFYIGGKIYFSKHEHLELLQNIESHYSNRSTRSIVVKNGFATLADKVFIGNFSFSGCTISVLKASTGRWYKCIFPYHPDGSPISLEELMQYEDVYNYLCKQRSVLEERDSEDDENWFLFGRSQAIKDVFVEKIAINTTIKGINTIRIETVPSGSGVYSGLYILSSYDEETLRNVILTEDFIIYLQVLKNYKSSGYYSISTLELEKFLSYKLEKLENEQLRIFG